MSKLAAKDVIFTLGMRQHPEGGWYARTFEDGETVDGRARSTAVGSVGTTCTSRTSASSTARSRRSGRPARCAKAPATTP